MDEIMLKIENVSKMYKLGQIGGTSLRDELQRRKAKRRGEEDPTKMIGAKEVKTGETFMALNGVSFEVKKGERVGIIGHNGAGKSTLLKLISRVTAPTDGRICMNGRVASMLEVGTGFHGELTGRENIYMNGAILGMTKKEIDAKMEDIIEFSECRQFIDTPVKRYSSGMYVKLAFSVAAHLDSEIMIMDEVLAVGDMAFQKKCLEKMSDVSKTQGRTILYVSHNMNTIRQLCDRCIVLDHGKVVFDGEVEKGINVYLGNVRDKKACTIDLEYEARESWAHTDKVIITGFEALDKTKPTYSVGEKLRALILCSALQNVRGIQIRFEIKDVDGTPVMTYNTIDSFSLIQGEQKSIEFQLDISSIAPGEYYLGFLLFLPSGFEGYEDLDAIPIAYSFDINADTSYNHGISWKKNLWGYHSENDVKLKIRNI